MLLGKLAVHHEDIKDEGKILSIIHKYTHLSYQLAMLAKTETDLPITKEYKIRV
jgi:hypothetical protein